jgi:glycosyltransferase involved in cell wall biosynthesis
MHVLMLPSWYSTTDKPWRGTFIKDQAMALSRAGIEVGVAYVERRGLHRLSVRGLHDSHFQVASEVDEGIPTVRMKGWSTFAQTVPGSLLWCRLTRGLAETYARTHGTPDLIHGHAALWGGYAAKLASVALGCPYLITEHSSDVLTRKLSPFKSAHAAAAYRHAAAVISVSSKLQASVDAVAGQPLSTVIPNTVDTTYFQPVASPAHPFTFLAVSDLVGYKRVDLLLRAFARIRMRSAACRLVIVGGGKAAARLQALARWLGLQQVVHFTGPLARPSVRDWMRQANALVLASTFETFGVVLIEAMASGLPVLATRCGGPEEIVSEESGLLVPPGDEEALADGLGLLLERPFDPARIRALAEGRYGYPVVAAALQESYARALAKAQQRADAVAVTPLRGVPRGSFNESGPQVVAALTAQSSRR